MSDVQMGQDGFAIKSTPNQVVSAPKKLESELYKPIIPKPMNNHAKDVASKTNATEQRVFGQVSQEQPKDLSQHDILPMDINGSKASPQEPDKKEVSISVVNNNEAEVEEVDEFADVSFAGISAKVKEKDKAEEQEPVARVEEEEPAQVEEEDEFASVSFDNIKSKVSAGAVASNVQSLAGDVLQVQANNEKEPSAQNGDQHLQAVFVQQAVLAEQPQANWQVAEENKPESPKESMVDRLINETVDVTSMISQKVEKVLHHLSDKAKSVVNIASLDDVNFFATVSQNAIDSYDAETMKLLSKEEALVIDPKRRVDKDRSSGKVAVHHSLAVPHIMERINQAIKPSKILVFDDNLHDSYNKQFVLAVKQHLQEQKKSVVETREQDPLPASIKEENYRKAPEHSKEEEQTKRKLKKEVQQEYVEISESKSEILLEEQNRNIKKEREKKKEEALEDQKLIRQQSERVKKESLAQTRKLQESNQENIDTEIKGS